MPKAEVIPDPVDRDYPPPRYLRKEAKQFWRGHMTQLKALGILTRLDLVTLEMASHWYGEFRRHELRARRRPRLPLKDGKGRVVNFMLNPDATLARHASKLFDVFAVQLGLSPTARTRITVGETKTIVHENSLAKRLFDSV